MRKCFCFSMIVSLCLTLFTPSTAIAASQNVISISNRGYSISAPENTLPAYALAGQIGFSYVEGDVSFTSDGMPVMIHDSTINRTARHADGSPIGYGDVFVSDISYKDLLKYDFGIHMGQAYKGTPIPTFEQFLTLCKNYGLSPYIKINDYALYERRQIEALVDMVEKKGLRGKVTWISFSDTYLSYVRDKDKQARLGLIAAPSDGDERAAVESALLLCTANNHVFLDVPYDRVNNILINICSKSSVGLEVWNVWSAEQIQNLNPYVTGITTDTLRYEDTITVY